MTRFLPSGNGESALSEERKRQNAFRSALDLLLLTDPVYAAAYQKSVTALATAETTLQDALSIAAEALSTAKDRLQAIEGQASRLENGARVFRRSDGAVVDETGRIVSDADAAGIVWKPGSPSYDAYLKAKGAVDQAKTTIAELELYQIDVLGHWRDRLDDKENPPSLEELEQLHQHLLERAPAAALPKLEAAFEVQTRQADGLKPGVANASSPGDPTARSDTISLPKI